MQIQALEVPTVSHVTLSEKNEWTQVICVLQNHTKLLGRLGYIVSHYSHLSDKLETNTFLSWKTLLSILTVFVSHFNMKVRSTTGLKTNSCIISAGVRVEMSGYPLKTAK